MSACISVPLVKNYRKCNKYAAVPGCPRLVSCLPITRPRESFTSAQLSRITSQLYGSQTLRD